MFFHRCGGWRPDLLSGEGASRLVYGGNADGGDHAPFIFFALYEKDGQPAEKYLYHIVQSMFIRDKVRPYRTNNLYAEIQQKIKEQEELQLEQQHSKGKA